MQCQEAQELITGLIDNELSVQERQAIDAHLGDCPHCRVSYANEMEIKHQVRSLSTSINAPAELRQHLSARAAHEVEASEQPKPFWSITRWLGFPQSRMAVFAAALMVVVLVSVYLWQPAPGVALSVLETHRMIDSGKLSFLPARNPAELKAQLTRAVDNRFEPMGYDLSAMKLYPISGAIQEIGERKILVTVYGGDGPAITCFTFLGTEADAPKTAAAFRDEAKGINLYTYSEGDISAVLHREGGVICILVSKMPAAELLALARAKARHA